MFRPTLGAGALYCAMLGAFLSTPAQAADMPFPVEMPPAVNDGPIEWGSNWYLRGDFGIAGTSPTSLNFANLSPNFPNNWNIGLGGGYKFNNYFRGDITVDYQSLFDRNGVAVEAMRPCTVGLILDPVDPTQVLPVNSSCLPVIRNRTESMIVLANAYFDLGTWYGFTPYVGAGVGLNVLYQRSQAVWYFGNGNPSAGYTFSDPRTGTTYMINMDSRFEGTYLRFAYAFMGGVAYDIDDHWKVDVGYRYLNLGKITGVDRFNLPVSRDITSHQVRVGFRYMID